METYGWDVVCACSAARLDALLAKQFEASPASLHYEAEDGSTIEAELAPWHLVAGGANKKLHMECPITKGSVSTPMGDVPLDGVTCVIEVELAFVSDAEGKKRDLRFDLRVEASAAGDETPGSVFVVNPDKDGVLAGKDPGGAGKMTLHDGLAACLVANREKLAFVVASMDLTPSGEGAWLVPHHSSYCYVQGGAGAAGYLAVLSVVDEGRDVSKLGRNVDPALCDGKHDTCVAYHKRVFLEHVVRPQLKDGYPGATDASFLMVGDEIYAVPLLCCPPVRYGLIDYEPFLWSMKVAVSASHVTTEAMGSFAIKGLPDATASFKVSTSATCSYDAAGGVLSMKAAEEPKTSSSTHIPWYDYLIAGPFLLLIGGIVGAIAGVIVGVVIAVVTDAIAGKSDRQTKAESGSLALADWTAARIAWPGSERWRVDEVTLSDALVLRCTLKEPA